MKLAIIVLILGFCYCGSYATANRFVCAQYHGEINPFQAKLGRHEQVQKADDYAVMLTPRKKEYDVGWRNTPIGRLINEIENSEIAMPEKKEFEKRRYKSAGYNNEYGRSGRSSDNYFNRQDKSVYEQGTYNTVRSRLRRSPEYELDQQDKSVYEEGTYNTPKPRPGRSPEYELDRDIRVLQGPAGKPIYLSDFAHNDYEF